MPLPLPRLFAMAAAAAMALSPVAVQATETDAALDAARDAAIRAAVTEHALPGFAGFAAEAAALEAAAAADCGPDGPGEALRAAWGRAFDAWLAVSHLRFGPTEVDNRAFGLGFWPDAKGFTDKALRKMLLAEAPPPADPEAFAHASIAGRGFHAMARLLWDPEMAGLADAARVCAILSAQAADAARIAAAIDEGWREETAPALLAHDGDHWRNSADAAKELYKALDAGLQFLAEARLGRPLGTLERPRPNRAEMRRAGRSLENVTVVLAALDRLHAALAGPVGGAPLTAEGFARARDLAARLDDPVFAGAADPAGRFRIEALKTAVESLRESAANEIGTGLGVSAGFNALDGD